MKKAKIQYTCSACGSISPKWVGQCMDCQSWNSLVEEAYRGSPSFRQGYAGKETAGVVTLSEITTEAVTRVPTGLEELDRVLGGGLVPGSVVLIGGDPGIGKSTLLLQTMAHLSEPERGLYISGEESLHQISLRAERLGIKKLPLKLLSETQVEEILSLASRFQPKIMVIDSVQTLFTETVPSAPGSLSQVRESTALLVRFAKQTGISLYLVGHVNKEGGIAGPRVLEHMVDTVLYFEGEQDSRFRVVRAMKNRWGAVNTLGIFAMTDKGLRTITNPSAIFLSHKGARGTGTVVMITWEGNRPLLIEIQALVAESFGIPRRVTVGYDPQRLALLLAVLHRQKGVTLHQRDVFLNVVGGVRITETGADLAILMAVFSSLQDKTLEEGWVVFGEVGLGGELRPVPGGVARLVEAAKHGFRKAVVPKANAPREAIPGLQVEAVDSLKEALGCVLG